MELKPDYEKDLQLFRKTQLRIFVDHGVNLDELAYMLEEDYINRSRLHKVIELVEGPTAKRIDAV